MKKFKRKLRRSLILTTFVVLVPMCIASAAFALIFTWMFQI